MEFLWYLIFIYYIFLNLKSSSMQIRFMIPKSPLQLQGVFFIAIFQNYIKPSPCKAGFPYTSRRGLEIYALCNGSGKPRSIFVPEPAILQFLLLFAGVRHWYFHRTYSGLLRDGKVWNDFSQIRKLYRLWLALTGLFLCNSI